MKKILSIIALFALLLLPMKIKAAENIEIKSIDIVEQSVEGIEKSAPTYKDLKVYFDLKFVNVNESIKYKVVLKNNDDQEYEVQETTKKSEDNYIEYKTTYEGESNIVKVGEEKTIYITVTYVEEVPVEEFVDGIYNAQNNIKILLDTKEKNPNTLAYGLVAVAAPLLLISVIVLIVSKNKMAKLMSIAITGMLIIPLVGIAIEKIEIEIASQITIHPSVKTFVIEYEDGCGITDRGKKAVDEESSDSDNSLGLPKIEYEYVAGMNWEDFFDSDYYDGELPDLFVEQILNSDDIWFDKPELFECLNNIEYPEEDDMTDYTDDEWENLWDDIYDQEDDCYDKYSSEIPIGNPIKPKEKGYYYMFLYCPAPGGVE